MSKRLLWVEDEALKLEGLVKPLKDQGYFVDYAFSELDAEMKIQSGPKYDLLIIDLIIPAGKEGDRGDRKLIGVDLIKRLRIDLNVQIPIVVVSVVNDTAVINSLKNFISLYLAKRALRPSKLKEEVDRILGV
jgi:CheY-like chemotaxis protein